MSARPTHTCMYIKIKRERERAGESGGKRDRRKERQKKRQAERCRRLAKEFLDI